MGESRFTPNNLPDDFMLELARGNVPGMTHVNKFGRNPDTDQAASATAVNIGRTIWDGGIAGAANWVAPTTARTHQIVSTDTSDVSGGAGAQTVKIFGLDSAFALQEETVTMEGDTNVATASTYTMIHRMEVLTVGATGWNEGDITATADTDTTVTAQITALNNQTLMAIYQIPAAKTGYLTEYFASLQKKGGAAKFVDIFLMGKKSGGPWRVQDSTDLGSDGTTFVEQTFTPYKSYEAKELIQLVANPSADAQDISGGFDLILVDD